MDLHQFSENDGLPQIEKVWELDVNELVIDPKPFARGAFSQVFKGEYFGTKICVKMLKGYDAELLKFTCREISSLKFNHPNCVQFIGVAQRNDEILIATEYVAGGNLRQYLKDSNVALPWDLRIKMALDIASGMAFLHSKNVIHRDLKSKNLLVGDNWRIKVCDFGFARSVAGNRRQLMTVCGTNDWMAPEIILGHPYDAKADVFSFGMVLVELITRRKVGEDVRRGPETHYRVDEDLLRSFAPKDTPPNLLDLALQCCAYDSNVRPSFKDITKLLKSMIKKKEERTISPFYGACPPVLRPEPISLLTKSLPSSKNNSINSNTSFSFSSPLLPTLSNNNSNHSNTSNNSNNNNNNSNNSYNSTHNVFSLSGLGSVLPSTSSRKDKAPRVLAHPPPPPPPTTGWATSWESPASPSLTPSFSSSSSSSPSSPFSSSSSFTPSHGNPLYQPRMFAEVVLTDSHPRRHEMDMDSSRKIFTNSPELGSRKRDHDSNNTRSSERERDREKGKEKEREKDTSTNLVVAESVRDSPTAPLERRKPSNSNKRSRR